MKVLITGATGFVGGAVLARMRSTPDYALRAAVRPGSRNIAPPVESVVVEGLSPTADWRGAVSGCTAVVHAAARVHVMQETAADPLREFRRVNVEGTINLARQAAMEGVRRFVYISSIKVNGESTALDPYSENDPPAPEDPYGVSKHEAETGLRQLAAATGMEMVIIRPVLAYGPGVKGNFRTLLAVIARGLPLPLAAIANKRSFIGIDNLVDLITVCLQHPAAAGQTFLAGDGEDLSTPELVQRVAKAMGRPARLFSVPVAVLQWLALLTGRQAVMQRLCGSLQVDIGKARRMLGWSPKVSVDEGLRRSVAGAGPESANVEWDARINL